MSQTHKGPSLRARRLRMRTRVGSASALNQPAYSSASVSLIVDTTTGSQQPFVSDVPTFSSVPSTIVTLLLLQEAYAMNRCLSIYPSRNVYGFGSPATTA